MQRKALVNIYRLMLRDFSPVQILKIMSFKKKKKVFGQKAKSSLWN